MVRGWLAGSRLPEAGKKKVTRHGEGGGGIHHSRELPSRRSSNH